MRSSVSPVSTVLSQVKNMKKVNVFFPYNQIPNSSQPEQSVWRSVKSPSNSSDLWGHSQVEGIMYSPQHQPSFDAIFDFGCHMGDIALKTQRLKVNFYVYIFTNISILQITLFETPVRKQSFPCTCDIFYNRKSLIEHKSQPLQVSKTF